MRPSSTPRSARTRWLSLSSLLVGLLSVIACSTDSGQTPSNGNDPTCGAGTQACGGVCKSLSTDATSCGACGTACTAGHVCQAGRCTLSCSAPNVECGGLCVNTSSNALHCGACNQPCAGGQICQAGACVSGGCPTGQSLCNGACVDTLTDTLNCGACAAACVVGQSCQGGTCLTPGAGGAGGAATGGSAGAVSSGGTSAGGSAGADAGSAGTVSAAGGGAGGSAGTETGGAAGTGTAGGGGNGGEGQAGTTATGGGGQGPGVMQSATCPNITWPSSTGTRNLGSGITVGAGQTHDGGMQIHEGNLDDCGTGDQDSTDPLIEVANGGTVKNVIMGRRVGDGIHCLGSCTIDNVWFSNVCDDAITILGSGTVTIKNSGFKNARDKTIQHNGTATVNIENVYVETAGKLYRSCGDGCSGSSRTANLTNIVAIGVDQVAGVSTNDTVTLKNICVHRTFSICSIYEPGSSDEIESGVNGSNEGPNANCKFSGADTHALLTKVSGIPFTTESVCGGPNGYKSGSTATACVSGFDKCLKACMPGGYGFKEITCTNNKYAEGTGAICAMPTDPTAAMNLAPSRVMGATTQVDNNDECSTEWAIGIQRSNNANFCVCVHKPGYYGNDNWLAWDCQRRWW